MKRIDAPEGQQTGIYVTMHGAHIELTADQVQDQCRIWMAEFDRGRSNFKRWNKDPSYFWAKKVRTGRRVYR